MKVGGQKLPAQGEIHDRGVAERVLRLLSRFPQSPQFIWIEGFSLCVAKT